MRAKTVKESAGGAGGAGYAVWGGGWGRTFGNPSLGGRVYGRGFGFGQGSSSGGPNLMYTYSIKPLDPILQQPPTPQGKNEYIHTGSEIKGKVLGKDKEVHGKISSIKEDGEGNILYYIVQEFDTASKFHVDPTSVILINHDELPGSVMRDFVASIDERYFPSFNNFVNEKYDTSEETKNIEDKIKNSKKLPAEMKEKILPLVVKSGIHGTRYKEGGKVFGLKYNKSNGCDLGADKNGFFVFTHRARSKSYPEINKIPQKDIKFIESTG
jgi:hypothetical protein